MAHYRHLPIWKAAMDLAVHLEHAVRRFGKTPSPPRYHKYTLGSELRQTAQRLCRLVARTNNAAGDARFTALDQLVLGVAEMKTLLRQRLKARAVAHTVVSQTGHFKAGFKHRTLTAVWYPALSASPSFLFTPAHPPLRA